MPETTIPSPLRRRLLAAGLAALAALPLSGCWGSSQANAVDPPRAREALKIALEHWKSGESPRSLQSSSTPMIVQDFDWIGGAKLLDYRIDGPGRELVGQQNFPVTLTLEASGRKATRRVEYQVTTDPILVVSRQD